jgi:hypothetical protein
MRLEQYFFKFSTAFLFTTGKQEENAEEDRQYMKANDAGQPANMAINNPAAAAVPITPARFGPSA